MTSKKPTLLFYCQHLLGIGHLTRSLAICEALVNDFEVHFIQGGPDVGKTIHNPSFHHHFLNPLLMRESDSSLYDPAGQKTPEDLFSLRQANIHSILEDTPIDVIVTELFPFGRNKFKNEVLDLIAKAKSLNKNIYVTCSIRDILVEKQDSKERELKMVRLIQEHYDSILVHSDENILRFDETFSSASFIQEKLKYTGFVTETPRGEKDFTRRKEILVSMGGGAVGDELVRAVVEIAPSLEGYLVRIAPGPYASSELKAYLMEKAKDLPNLRIETFLNNFEEELSQVALSISLAGYNTMMNILNTKTPALVYPYMANIEQNLRATRMADRGLMTVIYEKDLSPEPLLLAIQKQLKSVWPEFDVALNGSATSSKILLSEIEKKRN